MKDKNSPLVSICMPMYNVEKYIEETIGWIKRQTYKNLELIIVDDHSTDNSFNLAVAHASDWIKVYKNPNKGGNAARNYAFQMSAGEYIKFLDADDYCSVGLIEKQLKRILEDGTEKTLIFSPLKLLYKGQEPQLHPRTIDRDYTPAIELLIDIWRGKGWNCPHCHLCHRSLITSVNGWDESVLKNQDGEFFARIAAAADKALAVPDEFAIYRRTYAGVSHQFSMDAQLSMLKTYDIITDLLLEYKDTTEIREISARYVAKFVFQYYPAIEPLLPDVYKLLNKLKQPLLFPDNNRRFRFLKTFLGWKLALRIIKTK